MGPNDAELVRVSTRRIGSKISDITIDLTKNAEVVVESEYGAAIAGQPAQVSITVIDEVDSYTAIYNSGPVKFNAVPGDREDVITIPSAAFKGRSGHSCHVIARLLMNIAVTPDASFAKSTPFLLVEL